MEDLRAWMRRHNLTVPAMVTATGDSYHMIRQPLAGLAEIGEGTYRLIAEVDGQRVADAIAHVHTERACSAAQRIRERLLQRAAV